MKLQEQLLLSKSQAADALSVSPRTIDYLIASKRLTPMKIGKRVLISRRALEELAHGK